MDNKFTIDVQCGPASGVISEGAFPNSLTTTQYVNKNVGGVFELPQFTTSMPTCPITTYLSSDQNTVVNLPATGFVQNPLETSAGSGMFKVPPQDDTIDGKYEFYVNVAATGGAVMYSQKMTLIVGCTADLTQTQNAAFDTAISVAKGYNPLDIYTIQPPVVFPSYC